MENSATEIVFYNRMVMRTRLQARAEWAVVLLMLALVPISLLILVKFKPAGTEWTKLISAVLSKRPFDTAMMLLVLVGALLSQVYSGLARKHERLILSADGIRFQSPLPPALRFLRPDWKLHWGEVRAVTFARPGTVVAPMAVTLKLRGGSGVRRLRPFAWVDDAELQRLQSMSWRDALRESRQLRGNGIAAAIDSSALMRGIRSRLPNLAITRFAEAMPASFALEKNRYSLIAVIAVFVLIGYAIADFVVFRERYVEALPIKVFATTGVTVTLLAFVGLLRGAVPLAERTTVSLLLGAAFAVAAYPGLLRINQATDPVGLRDYRYRLESGASLTPEQAGLPALAFPEFWDYWAQFPRGSVHEFRLRKGGLGFWQMDMAPFHKKTREFYAKHP